MLMKSKDCALATALIIQGYLRANGDTALPEALAAIKQECSDWAENLASDRDMSAVEPDAIDAALSVAAVEAPRTPYNLVSAAISLMHEAYDLSGDSAMADLRSRMPSVLA